MEQNKITISVDETYIKKTYINTQSDYIAITHDKLEVILIKHSSNLSKRDSWQTPVAFFVSILATILTADFKASFGIAKEIWTAIFWVGLVLSFAWSVKVLSKTYFVRKKCTVEYLLTKIKSSTLEIEDSKFNG